MLAIVSGAIRLRKAMRIEDRFYTPDRKPNGCVEMVKLSK